MTSVSFHQVCPLHEFRSVEGFLVNSYKQNGHIQSLWTLELQTGLQQVPKGANALLKLSHGEDGSGLLHRTSSGRNHRSQRECTCGAGSWRIAWKVSGVSPRAICFPTPHSTLSLCGTSCFYSWHKMEEKHLWRKDINLQSEGQVRKRKWKDNVVQMLIPGSGQGHFKEWDCPLSANMQWKLLGGSWPDLHFKELALVPCVESGSGGQRANRDQLEIHAASQDKGEHCDPLGWQDAHQVCAAGGQTNLVCVGRRGGVCQGSTQPPGMRNSMEGTVISQMVVVVEWFTVDLSGFEPTSTTCCLIALGQNDNQMSHI